MSEASLTAQVIALLKVYGCWSLKVHGHPWQRSGVPDIIACVPPGRFLAIEVKMPHGRLTPLQKREHVTLTRAGAVHVVAYSVADVEDALRELRDAPK